MPDLEQHEPFVDTTPARRPWWLPAFEPDADWTFPRSGDFPTLPDPALCAPEEKP